MSWQIGPYKFPNNLVLAPMAGVTDRPFRQLCRSLGAGMTVSEMVSSKPELRQTRKSRLRTNHQGEPGPVIVQIAGTDPAMMADAARYNVDQGAQIIDINMGCPAKKVCKVEAGSALMKNEDRVKRILNAVVNAVSVPVILKTRTGWDREHKNIPRIASIAEECGIQAITIHGRTREDKYNGDAEYDTIRLIKQQIRIPLIANGDIDCAKKARTVIDFTGADAIMVGRAAQHKPWIFNQIAHYLKTGNHLAEPDLFHRKKWLSQHLQNLYEFYGEIQGLQIARKHINWQLGQHSTYQARYKHLMMLSETPAKQMGLIEQFFDQLHGDLLDRAC
ncbi:MAG: tRNA dihydrouridine synthase DusB [Gammaproteobacteria bacterium]|nr:tRNA dihydrouridine synthase DusB [Gammaproteobacteria bacterium]MBL7000118.1 tRNA dihydrouridine synthase DusB [Gammaproteobacteria bacterium]